MRAEQKRFYVDTAVWRDYFEDRRDGLKPLGEFAFQFFQFCNENNYLVLYSDVVLVELLNEYSLEQIFLRFEVVRKDLIKKVEITQTAAETAKYLTRSGFIHKFDAFHASIARENEAIVVARDFHFKEISWFVESQFPEEAILY